MPSTNEHYIPKFLLKGFASSTRRNQVYTWLFRHCLEPIETNTRNIGSEFDFYAGIANRNADTAIKPLERELAKYVGKLRRVTKEIRLTDTIVPELVVHVMLRNNCLRQAMIRLVQKTTEIMKARMQNQETLPRYALKAFSQRPAEFIAAFQEGARMAGLDQQWSLSMLDGLFRNPPIYRLQAEISSEMEEYFKDLNVFLSKNFAEFAKTSHVEGLLTATLPTQWVEAIEDWNWFLVIRDKGTFILGDVGPLFKVNGSTQYRSLPSSLHEFNSGICQYPIVAYWLELLKATRLIT